MAHRAAATVPETLSSVLDDLARRGFTEQFEVAGERLRAVGSGRVFPADELSIREHHRFEGVSDPDDMAVVYAIETASGVRGTLVDAFGVYADPGVSVLLRAVRVERH